MKRARPSPKREKQEGAPDSELSFAELNALQRANPTRYKMDPKKVRWVLDQKVIHAPSAQERSQDRIGGVRTESPRPEAGRKASPRIRSTATPSRSDQGAGVLLKAQAVGMGPPMTYGNKRAWVNPKTGRAILSEARGRHGVNVRTWQDAFRKSMAEAVENLGDPRPIAGPARITIWIYLARPKSHYGKLGLNAVGRRSPFPTRKPDAEKVGRAVADAGTGIWYLDDAQLVSWKIEKEWADDGLEKTIVEVEAIG